MKRTLLLIAMLQFCANMLIAQPTLTAATSTPQIGVSYYGYLHNNFTSSPAGANQSWDFSQANYFSPFGNKVVACSTMANCSNYPGSTLVLKDTLASSKAVFMHNDGTGLYTVGENGYYSLSDPDNILRFPMVYGTSYVDMFKGIVQTSSGGIYAYRFGTDSVRADSWGTLKLPNGTFTNTLRVRRVQVFKDSIGAGGPSRQDVSVSYTWYSPNYKLPLFYTDSLYSDFGGTGSTLKSSYYIAGQSSTTSTGVEPDSDIQSINIFPLPAHDVIHILVHLKDAMPLQLSLCDQTGRIIKTYNCCIKERLQKIDLLIENLSAGFYTLRISSTTGTSTKKIVIE